MSLDSSETLFDKTPFGDTVDVEDVIDTLTFFDDWEDRYRYIIDLGKQLPAFPESLQTECSLVRGCQSKVWIEIDYDAAKHQLRLAADSDAIIVRGLVALILAALNRRSPQEILDYDMEGYFASIDLVKHLSPTRGNGIRAMVKRIKAEAQRFAA